MATKIFPLDLCNVALGMNCLVTAAIPRALELVTFSLEDWFLIDKQSTSQVPTTRFAVLDDFCPDFVGLCLARECDVFRTVEITAVFAGNESGNQS